jgi:FKBP-type peptidyl-prolyl cis-trans isomerase
MGANLRKQSLDIDQKEVVHGLRDGLNGEKAALNEAELSTAQQAFTRMAAAKQQELQNKNAEASKKFLEDNKKNADWKTTASGLQYKIIKDGAGKLPTEKDTLKVHYVGTLVDGTKFDSSRDRTAPAEYQLGKVIKGLHEALSMMKKGSHWVVLLPPELAYGPSGNGPIPPSAVLMYDLELIDIVPTK